MSTGKSQAGNKELRMKNADAMSVTAISKEKFPLDTVLFLTTDSYVGEFKITEVRSEQGTEFRRMAGRGGEDVIVNLGFLQSEKGRGNIKFIGEDGKIIGEENKNEA